MCISVFDLFSIGIGPSSSHTMGPMRAALDFVESAETGGLLAGVKKIEAHLYGSLALTGKGHGTDVAVMMGMLGHSPESIDPKQVPAYVKAVTEKKQLAILKLQSVKFQFEKDIVFHTDITLPKHANGMMFKLFNEENNVLFENIYYSLGGGFITTDSEYEAKNASPGKSSFLGNNIALAENKNPVPHPFTSADELLNICKKEGLSIAEVVMTNELSLHPLGLAKTKAGVEHSLLKIWSAMKYCIDCGSQRKGSPKSGVLPGGLNVKRRAPSLYKKLEKIEREKGVADEMNWVNFYALAVNEENAAGGRIVTAPTNGAAGIVPAVISYYVKFHNGDDEGIKRFLLTAGAIGMLYKYGASISGAEVGCQGEIGVACSMAAAGLCAAWQASPGQIENAAEIGMEHHLGLTCDPVGGLVQIPCIERNAMGAVQAVNTAKLAMIGDGTHRISLDEVIKTMRETGRDMMSKYKETALGGLAKTARIGVNLPSC